MSQQLNECELCHQRFNLFRRKKQCDFCGQELCSKCTSKITRYSLNTCRICTICSIIVNERTTRDQLNDISIKHLRAYLIHSKLISIEHFQTILEKQDLINLVEIKKRLLRNNQFVFVQREETSDQNQQETTVIDVNSFPSDESSTEENLPRRRANLQDISSLESIHDLSVLQLKEILVQNFVSIKGCVEKQELITKVELLYRDYKKQSNTDVSNENLCKICMDAAIDCVFLDCGHLCTCVQCGKQLSECPLCRSYIVRALRVFKS